MNFPIRENLEIHSESGGTWVRCTRCLYQLCQGSEDWSKHCLIRRWPPTKAGPLMADLTGHFLLEQWCCPSCGVLLHTDLVEAKAHGGNDKTE